jgi:BirA family transcriptional regulator, biotin operon repressor / biotin---[acetyl-CoA-carboxylase] ligase
VTAIYEFLSRHERFRSVPSTNDIVRTWMTEGTPEVCLAVADEQTAGRGRSGRSWVAPSGAALLLSLGFEPAYLAPDRLWRLAAIVALAMADAAEETAGLPIGTLRLKWPNDIVVEAPRAPAGVRKVAGVLGESEGAGSAAVRTVVGIGVNADWRRDQFPAELADVMTSLREVSRGRPIDTDGLLDGFVARLEPRVAALRDGHFDVAGWHARQVTTGRTVRIDMPDGTSEVARAVGVDGATGALLIEESAGGEQEILVGEVTHVRLVSEGEAALAGTTAATAGAAAGTDPGGRGVTP